MFTDTRLLFHIKTFVTCSCGPAGVQLKTTTTPDIALRNIGIHFKVILINTIGDTVSFKIYIQRYTLKEVVISCNFSYTYKINVLGHKISYTK